MSHTQPQPPPRFERRRGNPARVLSCLLVAGLVLGLALILANVVAWISRFNAPVEVIELPEEGCQVSVEDLDTTFLTWEQAGNAAVIVGEAIRRGLPARAATIALVTVYQESDMRNLDYGDRDSVGLFQQRPSQGWGSVEQIMDPWYSSGQFYDHLVQVADWDTGVINDVAQAVQRSGFPEAYAQHETKGRAWASALTGYSPAAVSCIDRADNPTDFSDLIAFYGTVFGDQLVVEQIESEIPELHISPADTQMGWSAAQLAMLMAQSAGIESMQVYEHQWTMGTTEFTIWEPAEPGVADIIIRGRSS